jgi:peptide/nickel transport system permease protein
MGPRGFFIRRLVQTLVLLWVVLTLMFFLFRMMPGDPVSMLVSLDLDETAQERIRADWGLDQPVYVQYGRYLQNLLKGDWGTSFYYARPVWESVSVQLRNTLILMVISVLMALALSIPIGAFLGWKRGKRIERLGVLLPLAIRSIPIFWAGILLLMVFAFWLRAFPVGGMLSPTFSQPPFPRFLLTADFLRHLFLPFVCATLFLMPEPLMIMRTSTLEVKGEEFLELLKAKGMSEAGVIRHAARNSLLPVISWTTLMASFAFGGQVLLEVVFSWPGIGREMVLAVSRQDFPVAQATFFLMAFVVIVMNLILDMVYGFLDPRIVYK